MLMAQKEERELLGQAHTAMAIGVSDGHGYYWGSRGTARLVVANILGDCTAIDSAMIDNS